MSLNPRVFALPSSARSVVFDLCHKGIYSIVFVHLFRLNIIHKSVKTKCILPSVVVLLIQIITPSQPQEGWGRHIAFHQKSFFISPAASKCYLFWILLHHSFPLPTLQTWRKTIIYILHTDSHINIGKEMHCILRLLMLPCIAELVKYLNLEATNWHWALPTHQWVYKLCRGCLLPAPSKARFQSTPSKPVTVWQMWMALR